MPNLLRVLFAITFLIPYFLNDRAIFGAMNTGIPHMEGHTLLQSDGLPDDPIFYGQLVFFAQQNRFSSKLFGSWN